jgi:hypothetical protein
VEVLLDNLNSVDESNHFLRALWANIRAHFGNCAWQFSPYRTPEKKIIVLGFMNYKNERSMEVSLRYKRKGNLVAINFNQHSNEEPSIEDLTALKNLVRRSLKYKEQIKTFYYSMYFEVIRGNIAPYSSESYQLIPLSNNRVKLTIRVAGYDEVDTKSVANQKSKAISEIISVSTNYLIIKCKHDASEDLQEDIPHNQYTSDVSWIDDKPTYDKYVQLSEKACHLIDLVLNSGPQNSNLKLLLAAYSHFYSARALDALEFDASYFGKASEEIDGQGSIEIHTDERFTVASGIQSSTAENSATLYLSALEVASLLDAEKAKKCQECRQDVYSISARVQKFVRLYSKDDSLVNTIKSYYNLRSLYLHQGTELKNYSYVGTSLPVLDLDTKSHIREPFQVSLLNLREWSSFLLRQLLEINSLEKFD